MLWKIITTPIGYLFYYIFA